MADWSTPTLADTWANFTSFLKNRDVDLAQALDPAVATVTNPPTNAVRWNSVNKFWEKFNGTSWAALSASYLIQVGAFTGDVTKPDGTSALTIAANAVDNTKLRDSAALSVIGRAVNSSGDPADIAAAADDRLLTRVAGALAWTQLNAGMFPDDVVTYAKIQNISATDRMLGRFSLGAGDIEEIVVTAAGRAILDDADAAAQRATLGVPSGSGSSTGTNTGDQPAAPPVATQAEQEAGSSLTAFTSPGRQHFHPSSPKWWARFDPIVGTGAATVHASYNVTSISDNGNGLYTVTIATDFSSANWAGFVNTTAVGQNTIGRFVSQAAGSCEIQGFTAESAFADVGMHAGALGDQP